MKTGLIIVNYNDYKTTLELIDNVKGYKIIDSIIIVDNASTNNDYENLKMVSNERIIIIQNKINKGYSFGINTGLKYLKEKYSNCNVIVSNSDIIIKEESHLKKLIDNLNNYGVVAPIINEHGNINRGWKIPTPFVDIMLNIPFIYKPLRTKLLLYKDNHYDQSLVNVEVISGCFFLSRLDVLESINYFDENVFLYYEENILASKLKKNNIKTAVDTSVEVIHNHSVTIDKNINRYKKYKILKQSEYYFQTKYNNANILERILLLTSIKLGEFFQYLRSKI